MARLNNANCGSAWKQSFSADAFGNLKKTGQGGAAESFQPTYNLSNRVSLLGSQTPTYDADGNSTNDTVNSYNWDSDANMIKAVTPSATTQVTYDAMDRALEFSVGSSYTQIVYGPGGGKLALMSAQTLTKAFVPLSGGATAVYNSSGSTAPAYYRHADWLGSSRFASLSSGTNRLQYDGAYAPYGENYAETGTQDRSFTGQNQDMVSTGSYPLYDFLMREYNPTWGRWTSPDPAGLAAANAANPQTWNRYAYVVNNPLALVDPLGLDSNPPCYQYYCPPCDSVESCMQMYGGWDGGFMDCPGNYFGAPTTCEGATIPDASYGGPLPLAPFFGWPGGGGSGGGGPTGTAGGNAGFPQSGLPGPWQVGWPSGGVYPCDFGICMPIWNPYTLQVGGTFSLNFWIFSYNFAGGFAIDSHGHVASYTSQTRGAASGGSGSIGMQAAISNADTVCDLGGPFGNVGGTFGQGGSVSADVFYGNSPHGPVKGGGITAGAGAGGSGGSVGVTTTTVTPLGSVPCH